MVAQILIVMIAAIAVTIFAERRNIQPPLLLAAVGLAASFIPGLERLELEPEIILTVVLPPLLFTAAREFSFVSFIRRLGSILNLGVLLVAVTTGVVAAVASAVVPGMTIAVALVLGAVVSPPDAVTAVAVGRKLKLPGSMMTVLKGESLINDAAALTFFTFAVASVAGTHLFISNIVLYLLYAAVAGFVLGLVLGAIVHQMRIRITNASLATVLTVVVPFAAYLLAEELGASGVLAVVAAGLSLGHTATATHYDARIQERQFWRTTDALLEAFVFAYIGLQFRWIIADAGEHGFNVPELLGLSLFVLLAVIVVRIGWVYLTAVLSHWRHRAATRRVEKLDQMLAVPEAGRAGRFERIERLSGRRGRFAERLEQAREARQQGAFDLMPAFNWRENAVISWTGMRGVVTLAAAAGIPLVTATGEAFPGRDVIQVIAFTVTIGTLLLQGLTLPWLIRRLGIVDPGEAARRDRQMEIAEDLARQATIAAVTQYRDQQTAEQPRRMADIMLQRTAMQAQQGTPRVEDDNDALHEIARTVLAARRAAVIKARDERQIDDEVMRDVLDEMDLEQAVMENWTPGRLAGR
ncbi:MAG: sodium:proton antiporter [Hyphomicrobiales bacterium]|nr:MAG: sodium:proton antiporter [Hyphomicrobiales bacterium]